MATTPSTRWDSLSPTSSAPSSTPCQFNLVALAGKSLGGLYLVPARKGAGSIDWDSTLAQVRDLTDIESADLVTADRNLTQLFWTAGDGDGGFYWTDN